MTYLEQIKEELANEIKNKSLLEMAFLLKQTRHFYNVTMDDIVKALESEVQGE